MKPTIQATSLLSDPIRELRFPGYTNVFLITKIHIEGSSYSRYIAIDRSSMVILETGVSITSLIYRLADMLAYTDQEDLNMFINLKQEE